MNENRYLAVQAHLSKNEEELSVMMPPVLRPQGVGV